MTTWVSHADEEMLRLSWNKRNPDIVFPYNDWAEISRYPQIGVFREVQIEKLNLQSVTPDQYRESASIANTNNLI